MATLPTTTFYWRPKGGNASSWTEDADGVISPTDGTEIEVVSVGPSKSAFKIADTNIAVTTLDDVEAFIGIEFEFDASEAFTGTNIVYSLDQGPSWVSINPATGIGVGTSPTVDVILPVTVRGANSADFDTVSFNINVSAFIPLANPYPYSDPVLETIKATAVQLGASYAWQALTSADMSLTGSTANSWIDFIAGKTVSSSGADRPTWDAAGYMDYDGTQHQVIAEALMGSTPFTIVTIGRLKSAWTGQDAGLVSITNNTNANMAFYSQMRSEANNGLYTAMTLARSTATFDPVLSLHEIDKAGDPEYFCVSRFEGSARRSALLDEKGKNTELASYNPTGLNRTTFGGATRTTLNEVPSSFKYVFFFPYIMDEFQINALRNEYQNINPLLTYMTDYFGEGHTTPWYEAPWPNGFYDDATKRSYIAWEGWNGSQRVQYIDYIDHLTNKWGIAPFQYGTAAPIDDNDHGNGDVRAHPTNGWIYGRYNGHSLINRMQAVKFNKDLTRKVTQPQMPDVGMTYGHIYFKADGSILDLSRAAISPGYPFGSCTSTLDGNGDETRGSFVTEIDFGSGRVYPGKTLEIGNDIYLPITFADNGDSYRRHVYLFIRDKETGNYRNIQGTANYTPADFPITLTEANADFRIVDMGSQFGGSTVSIEEDANGRIHLAYGQSPTSATATDYEYRHIYWNGTAWSSYLVIGQSEQRFDSVMLSKNGSGVKAYFCIDEAGSTFDRGGDIAYKEWTLASGWGSQSLKQACDGLYPLNRPTCQLDSIASFEAKWCENVDLPVGGGLGGADAAGGNLRLYAHGVNGPVRRMFSTRPETDELLSRCVETYTDAEIIAIDRAMRSLVQLGELVRLDAYYLALKDADNGLNWVKNLHNLTINGTVTMTDFKGWQGDGSTGYLGTGFNPSVNTGALYNGTTQHLGLYNHTNTATDNSVAGIIPSVGWNNEDVKFNPRTSGDLALGRINQTVSFSVANTDARGAYVINRQSNDTRAIYKNGVKLATDTLDTNTPPKGEIVFLRHNTEYSARQINGMHWGGDMSGARQGHIGNITKRFMNDLSTL